MTQFAVVFHDENGRLRVHKGSTIRNPANRACARPACWAWVSSSLADARRLCIRS
jgi:hypothetical protein